MWRMRRGRRSRWLKSTIRVRALGRETLGTGAQFDYRFKILGSGGTTVSWTDAQRKQHSVKGPALEEGQDGKVLITIGPGDVAEWKLELHHL